MFNLPLHASRRSFPHCHQAAADSAKLSRNTGVYPAASASSPPATGVNSAAPTSGTYANILIYEPAGLSTSSFSINGSAGHAFTGLIYLPSRNVTFNSVSTVTSESITMVFNQLILDTINWTFTSGAKTITPAGGGGVRSVRLLY